jgi:pimeloyl-ACP methyl ester carboxylesterase
VQRDFLSYRASAIHYLTIGTGPQLVFGLHGYGESAQSFAWMGTALQHSHTLIAIDLPFHGQTEWKEGTLMEPSQLHDILQRIKSALAIKVETASVIGFSFGARIALSLIQQYPSFFDRLILLAPDGLVVNKWYWIATQTKAGNRFFAFTMKNPKWFFALIRAGAVIGVVNSSIQKFTKQYIHNDQVRNDLFNRWTCMRKFKPVLRLVKKNVIKHTIPVRLLYGVHDRMIMPAHGKKFREGIESLCTLQVIDSGHQVLHERNATHIINLFQQ